MATKSKTNSSEDTGIPIVGCSGISSGCKCSCACSEMIQMPDPVHEPTYSDSRRRTRDATAIKYDIETIYIKEGLELLPEVKSLVGSRPSSKVVSFSRFSGIVVPGDSMAEKINNGKCILVIAERASSMLDEFVNHDEGAVCSGFPKFVPSTNCPQSCEYCFLQGTYRACSPFVRVYVINFDKLEKSLQQKFSRYRQPALLDAGEMSDPLACDFLGYMPRLVTLFAKLENARLLLLTKTGIDEVQPLLNVDHAGHTVMSWSINCEKAIADFEHETASLAGRLAAAEMAQGAGYEVRFRLDPMLVLDGWEKAYSCTIDSVYSRGIRPSRFTLGSFRMLGNLRSIIAQRFPCSGLLSQPVEKNGKRWRYPQAVRERFYRHAIECIRQHDDEVPIALCKESPELLKVFRNYVDPRKCNCL